MNLYLYVILLYAIFPAIVFGLICKFYPKSKVVKFAKNYDDSLLIKNLFILYTPFAIILAYLLLLIFANNNLR